METESTETRRNYTNHAHGSNLISKNSRSQLKTKKMPLQILPMASSAASPAILAVSMTIHLPLISF